MRVARPHVAVRARRDFHGADGDRVHARLLSERGFAARIGGLDDIGRLPLREPQRLERERRREAGGPDDEKRHAADDLIMIGHQFVAPNPRAASAKMPMGATTAGKDTRNGVGSSPAMANPAFGGERQRPPS